MEWGITLARFYLSEAKRLAEAAVISDITARAEQLRLWLAGCAYDEITPSDILRNGPNALRERKALSEPLAMLVSAGHLVALPQGTVVDGVACKTAYRILR